MSTTQSKIVTALDIGFSGVKSIQGKLENGRLQILAFHERPFDSRYEAIDSGQIVNGENAISTINTCLKELYEISEEKIPSLRTNISSSTLAFSHQLHEKDRNGTKFEISDGLLENFIQEYKKEIRGKEEKDALIHLIPSKFLLDEKKFLRHPSGHAVNKLGAKFMHIHCPNDILYNHFNSLKGLKNPGENRRNQLDIKSPIFSAIAEAYAVLDAEDKEHGVILLGLGAEFTTISMYHEHGPEYLDVIPFGGNDITRDIATHFEINFEEADMVKKVCLARDPEDIELGEVLRYTFNKELPPKYFLEKSVMEIADWRLNEIIQIVYEKLKIRGLEKVPTRGIMLSGGMAALPITKKTVNKIFDSSSIRIANSTRNIDANGYLQLCKPQYATVVGVMLSQLVPFDDRLEFLNIDGLSKIHSKGFGGIFKNFFGGDDLDQRYID